MSLIATGTLWDNDGIGTPTPFILGRFVDRGEYAYVNDDVFLLQNTADFPVGTPGRKFGGRVWGRARRGVEAWRLGAGLTLSGGVCARELLRRATWQAAAAACSYAADTRCH